MAFAKPSAEQSMSAALQVFLRREGDRMHEDVELAPLIGDRVEHLLELRPVRSTSSGRNNRCVELSRERLDVGSSPSR